MFLIEKVSGTIGVWNPCAPFHVIFLINHVTSHTVLNALTEAGLDATHWIAMRVPSATRMKSYRLHKQRILGNGCNSAYREPVDNHNSLRFFDDVWENAQSRRYALVSSGKVNASSCAGVPDDVGCVDGILYLGTKIGVSVFGNKTYEEPKLLTSVLLE